MVRRGFYSGSFGRIGGPFFGGFGAPFLGGLFGGLLGSAIFPSFGGASPYPFTPFPYPYPYSYPYWYGTTPFWGSGPF